MKNYISKVMASSGVGASGVESHHHVGHDEGGEDGLQEDFRLTHFSFKDPFLGQSSLGIPPQLPDDGRCPKLRVKVEQAGEPGDLLPLVDHVPGVPRCEVVQEEGDEQHGRPRQVVIVLQLLLWDSSHASIIIIIIPVAAGMIGEASVKRVDERSIRIHVRRWQTDVQRSDEESLLHLLPGAQHCWRRKE